MFNPRPHGIAALALIALTIAAPAASAHNRVPDPIAHAAGAHHRTSDPVAHAALGSSCANANTPATLVNRQQMRRAVVCLVDAQRTSRRLPALHEQSQLERSAQNWTNTMLLQNIFTHGTAFANRIQAVGYDWRFAGENIATGFSTPQDVVTAWMASPDHCRNILDPQYASVGTGVASQVISAVASGGATWTQDFGTTTSQNAPSNNWGPANHCPYY